MKILKYSGETQEFDVAKLKNSLLKSGASNDEAQSVLAAIESSLYPGISTKRIHKTAKQLLRKISSAHAARYDIRTGLLMLGPSGFFFEKFLAKVFENEGFRCKTDMIVAGRCVAHEIDLSMIKDNQITLGECKFHNLRNTKCDVKIPLYVLSRFNDAKAVAQPIFGDSDQFNHCLIATNTRFTTDAAAFGACSGIQLLSWDYPKGNGIKDMVDNGNLYPITCLTTLTIAEKERLLSEGTILVKELLAHIDVLDKLSIRGNRKNFILKEARELCKTLLS